MYQVMCQVTTSTGAKYFAAVMQTHTMDKWHHILRHVNLWTIRTLKNNNLVTELIIDESQGPTQCTVCIQGKRHVDLFPKDAKEIAQLPRDLVVTNVWGPAQTEAQEKYFYSFTDAKTRYSTVYFGSTKNEALTNFETFKGFIETQTGKRVKWLRSDNGGEYINKPFKEYCATQGIIMETTASYSPAQNGIAEQLNQTLLEHGCAMIFAKGLPKVLWPEAVTYICYIKNRSLTQVLGTHTTPYQAFFGWKPDVSRLDKFGTRCWVMVPDQCRAKLDLKAEEHIFVGVAENVKAWKYYNQHSRHVQISRNITFDKQDAKLHPIPDGGTDNAELKGELGTSKLQSGGAVEETGVGPGEEDQDTNAGNTPQTSTATATPETIITPEIWRSNQTTNRPDY